jgi:1,2-diacylglycerol 3-beta-glucosyltransferase
VGQPEIVMTFVLFVLTAVALFYLIIGMLIHTGLNKKYHRSALQPFVSVLIAARNEEETLAQCLDSLAGSDYPRGKYEVFIIDDRSSDQTSTIARAYCDRFKNFKLYQIHDELNGLGGKMNALAQAIDLCTGDYIMITDADCRVGKRWLSGMVAGFTERTAIVGGLTLIRKSARHMSIFESLQALDLLFLQAIAAGTAGIGKAVSILGNNFGFRRSVYEAIGGFRQIGFSLTEDMALMQHLVSYRDYRLTYALQAEVMINTKPLSGLRDFYAQRKRWLSGGKKSSTWGYLLMSTAFFAHIMILSAVLFGFWTTSLLILILAVGLIDFSLIFTLVRRSGQKGILKFFPLFELFFTGYSLSLAVQLLWPGVIDWKGRKYGKGWKA